MVEKGVGKGWGGERDGDGKWYSDNHEWIEGRGVVFGLTEYKHLPPLVTCTHPTNTSVHKMTNLNKSHYLLKTNIVKSKIKNRLDDSKQFERGFEPMMS